ncbi:MAG: restriction endonuclease [Parcubacteria group bacterium]|nr:restriction endonuclease [Parcubacteria group bacterium]
MTKKQHKKMIKKSNGQLTPFDPARVLKSISRTGVDQKTAKDILKAVESGLTPRMHTGEIYKMISEELEKRKPWAAARYDLRDALRKMGPAGYNFEKYVASILSAYGYKTATPETYKGACIEHEIDVTAEKDGRTAFIEAKFRHDFGASVTIKDTMATWARFLDLVDGSKVGLCPHFDEVWIVTNARFTDQSLEFGHCKNMKLIGWNHPHERTFAQMVDLDALYPVTILKDLKPSESEIFAKADIMLCRDLVNTNIDTVHQQTGISMQRLEAIQILCKQVMHGDKA